MAAMENKTERAKNTASAKDIAKVLRGASLSVLPDPSSYMLADIEKVISAYEDFLADLCAVTARPTVPLLQSGFALVFKGVSKSDCRAFAEQVVKAVAECRARGRNSTSGKKLPSSIFRISQVLKGQEPQSTKRKSIASSRASSPPPTPKLPVEEAGISPKSKVLREYGLQGRALQQTPSDGSVQEVVPVRSSPSVCELSDNDGELKEASPESCRGCYVRAYASGKIEELSSKKPPEVLVRHTSKQPAKKAAAKKAAAKKAAAKKKSKAAEISAEQLELQSTTELHRVRVTKAKAHGSTAARSYVTACYCNNSKHKQSLVVEFSEKHYKDYQACAKDAQSRILEGKMTFQAARALFKKEKEQKARADHCSTGTMARQKSPRLCANLHLSAVA